MCNYIPQKIEDVMIHMWPKLSQSLLTKWVLDQKTSSSRNHLWWLVLHISLDKDKGGQWLLIEVDGRLQWVDFPQSQDFYSSFTEFWVFMCPGILGRPSGLYKNVNTCHGITMHEVDNYIL